MDHLWESGRTVSFYISKSVFQQMCPRVVNTAARKSMTNAVFKHSHNCPSPFTVVLKALWHVRQTQGKDWKFVLKRQFSSKFGLHVAKYSNVKKKTKQNKNSRRLTSPTCLKTATSTGSKFVNVPELAILVWATWKQLGSYSGYFD